MVWLWAGRSKQNIFSPTKFPGRLLTPFSVLLLGNRASFSRAKRPGRAADHSTQSISEITNALSSISHLPICLSHRQANLYLFTAQHNENQKLLTSFFDVLISTTWQCPQSSGYCITSKILAPLNSTIVVFSDSVSYNFDFYASKRLLSIY